MMDRNRVKLAIATTVLAGAAIVVLGAIAWGAQLHRAVLSGASPADVFTPIPVVPSGLQPDVAWRADLPTPREVEPGTRQAVQEAWTGALARLDVALRTGVPDDLPTNFSGPALDLVLAATPGEPSGTSQVPLAHDLQVGFYSDDGSILTLRDHGLLLRRVAGATTVEHREVWDVVLLLRDGRWRVEHLVRVSGEPHAVDLATPAASRP